MTWRITSYLKQHKFGIIWYAVITTIPPRYVGTLLVSDGNDGFHSTRIPFHSGQQCDKIQGAAGQVVNIVKHHLISHQK